MKRSIQLLKQIRLLEIMGVVLCYLLWWILKWELQRYHCCRCTHLPKAENDLVEYESQPFEEFEEDLFCTSGTWSEDDEGNVVLKSCII